MGAKIFPQTFVAPMNKALSSLSAYSTNVKATHGNRNWGKHGADDTSWRHKALCFRISLRIFGHHILLPKLCVNLFVHPALLQHPLAIFLGQELPSPDANHIPYPENKTHESQDWPYKIWNAGDTAYQAIAAALHVAGWSQPAVISVMAVGDDEMTNYNKSFRQISQPTNVLSFPATDPEELMAHVGSPPGTALPAAIQEQHIISQKMVSHPLGPATPLDHIEKEIITPNSPRNIAPFLLSETVIELGDLVLDLPYIQRQAVEWGKHNHAHMIHLLIHGVLHLLHYDHQTPDQARVMEACEVAAMARMGLSDPYLAPQGYNMPS